MITQATATIDLVAFTHNITAMRAVLAPETQILAVLKANAYGHGAAPVARHLETCGVTFFGVVTAQEAQHLIAADLKRPVLILTPVLAELEPLIDAGVRLTVTDTFTLECCAHAARAVGKPAYVHLKVDTGMGRLGGTPSEAVKLAVSIAQEKSLVLEGLWTHLACASQPDNPHNVQQLTHFYEACDGLAYHKLEVPLKHMANSAALFTFPDSHFDMVRPGITLYGYGDYASKTALASWPKLKPAMTITTPVIFVKRIQAGQSISYGARWVADKATNIATLRYGYADGYPRALSDLAEVWLAGKRRPIRGRVGMDQLMVDLGDDASAVGEAATIVGGEAPGAQELALLCSRIAYEILTSVGPRVQRVYI